MNINMSSGLGGNSGRLTDSAASRDLAEADGRWRRREVPDLEQIRGEGFGQAEEAPCSCRREARHQGVGHCRERIWY